MTDGMHGESQSSLANNIIFNVRVEDEDEPIGIIA